MGRFLSFSQNLPIWDAEARRAELLSGISQASRLSAYPLPTGGLAVKKVLGVFVELGEQGGAGLGGVGAANLAEHVRDVYKRQAVASTSATWSGSIEESGMRGSGAAEKSPMAMRSHATSCQAPSL